MSAPTFNSAHTDNYGDVLIIEWNISGTQPMTGSTGLTLSTTGSGGSISLYGASHTGTTSSFTLGRTILSSETLTLSYTPGNLADSSGNTLASFSSVSITNNSTISSIVLPNFAYAYINAAGNYLQIEWATNAAMSGTTGLVLKSNLEEISLTGLSNYYTLTGASTNRVVAGSEVLTLSYSSGDYQDAHSNSLSSFTNVSVMNNSTKSILSGTGNLTISWTENPRYQSSPLPDEPFTFIVNIYTDNTYTTIARTISVSGSTSTIYTAAEQITDFGCVQTTVYVEIYQTNFIGDGYIWQGTF